MPLTKPKVQAVRGLDLLSNIKAQASDLLRTILSLINNKVYFPMEITVSGKVISISASENQVIESDGAGSTQNTYKVGISPLERVYNSFVASTINYDTGAVTGAFETGADLTAPPSMTAGQKVYMGFEALSTGKIHVLWSEVGASPNVNTIAWTDASLKRGFVLLTCNTTGTGWGSGRFDASTNANIVQFGGSGGGGGGGDSSFVFRGVSGSTLTLSRGAIKLSNGDVLVTGTGTLSTTTRVDIQVSLGSVQNGTTTPVDGTTYYLYIDRLALGAAITLTDTGERVINVGTAGEFWLDTSSPDLMDPHRFIYLGWLRSATSGTAWIGTGAAFNSAPKFQHFMEMGTYEEDSDTVETNYVKNPNFEIDAVGAAPKFVTQSGQAGSGALVTATAGEILAGSRSLKLIGGNTGGSLRTWDFDLWPMSDYDAAGQQLTAALITRTTTTTGVFSAVMYNVTDAVEVPYTLSQIGNGDNSITMPFQPIAGKTYKLRIKEVSATTGAVIVDVLKLTRDSAWRLTTPRRYTTNVTTNSTSLSLLHGLGGIPHSIQLSYYDGTNLAPVDASSYVITKTTSALVLNTNDFDFTSGKYLEVQATYQVSNDATALGNTQFRSPWYTDTATTTVAHGLSDMDAIRSYVVWQWNTTTGERRIVTGLVQSITNTLFNLNWTGFTPSATLKYQIVCGSGALPQAIMNNIGGYTKFVGFGPGSYQSLVTALAAAGSGDRILVNAAMSIGSTVVSVAASDVTIDFMPGCYVTATTGGISIDANNVRINNLVLYLTGNATTALNVNGDDAFVENAKLLINTAVTVTNGFNIQSGKKRTWINGKLDITTGSITNKVVNNGTDSDYSIRG